MTRSPRLIPACVAVLALSIAPTSSRAEDGWRWSVHSEFATEYNDNVFGLDDDGKDRVDDQDSVDRGNGRIDDMESVDDFILTPRLAVTAETVTPWGRLSFSPRFAYHQYAENDAKSFSEFGFRVRQKLPQHSALELDFEYTLDAFKRNYLKDTVGTGTIDDTERIYEAGRYDDWNVGLRYKRRLWRGPRRDAALAWPSKLRGEIETEYGQRRFANGFDNRDRDVWRAGAALHSDLGDAVDLSLGYRFSLVVAPGDDEVLVLDEPEVGLNLNGDADLLDNNIRAVGEVDRSRDEHKVGIQIKLRPLERVRTWVSYNYSLRDYKSDEILDLAYRGRSDDVHGIRVGARWKFAKAWAATLEGRFSYRNVNRDAAALGDEDAEKNQNAVLLTFGHRF